MKHKQANKHPKRKLALKMQRPEERKIKGVNGSPFECHDWVERKEAKKKRITKKLKK